MSALWFSQIPMANSIITLIKHNELLLKITLIKLPYSAKRAWWFLRVHGVSFVPASNSLDGEDAHHFLSKLFSLGRQMGLN